MKKVAYIHIGLPKTGTTAIQKALQRQFDEKKLDKFNMQFLHNDIRPSIFDFHSTGDEKYFIEQIHKSITKYSKLGEKDVILSEEMIPYIFNPNEWGFNYDLFPILTKALKDYYNIKVIVYIRRQDFLIESLINNYAKRACYPMCNGTNFYYNKLINSCLVCFKGGVVVRKYERENLYGNDAVTDFLHIVGLDELIEDYIEHKGKIINSSLSSRSLQLAMADSKQYNLSNDEIKSKLEDIETQYKKGLISRESYTYIVWHYLAGLDICRFAKGERLMRMKLLRGDSNFSLGSSSQGILSDEERDRILEQYAEDNAIVARKYFGSEDGVLFNDKRPKNIIDIHAEPTTTDVVQFFLPIVTNLAQRCERLEQIIAKHLPEE